VAFTLNDIHRMGDGPAKRAILREIGNKPPAKRSKYRNVRTAYKGRTYDSKAEAERAGDLDMMKMAGHVWKWYPQVAFVLEGVRYIVDFLVFRKPGECWAEDVKGVVTPRFRAVKQLWFLHGPCELRIITRQGKALRATESIQPTGASHDRE
jgi:hypothetical protein